MTKLNMNFLKSLFRIKKSAVEVEHFSLERLTLLAEAAKNLGNECLLHYEFEKAEEHYKKAISILPTYAEAYVNLANIFMINGRYDDAQENLVKAINLKPELYQSYLLKIQLLLRKGNLHEALTNGYSVIQLNPECIDAYIVLGDIYKELKQYEEAEAMLTKAFALQPESAWAHYIHFHILLLLGDFKRGLAALEQYEKGHQGLSGSSGEHYVKKKFTLERYRQDDAFYKKSIFFWTEWGLGDSLLLLRYLPLFKEKYHPKNIIVLCEEPLIKIMQTVSGVDKVISLSKGIGDDQFDYHCSLISLPYLCGTQIETIPSVPYISISSENKTKWMERLASCQGLKIGLAWGGGDVLNVKDKLRSIPLKQFEPLFHISGITWISLQKGKPRNQLKDCSWAITDWTEELADMQDTAALIENLDLTISVDTSVINLVGALGRPGWVLNRYGSEWRWMLDREVTPWYPSIRIFNQSALNDWDSVISKMAMELKGLVSAHS